MSLIKLAYSPIIVVNHTDPNSGTSKTFNGRNITAATAGALGGFAASEGIEHIPKFNPAKLSHRFGRKMGIAAGAFAGAAGAYSLLKKKKEDSSDLLFY